MSLIHAIRRNAPSANTADTTTPEALDADRYGDLFTGPDWRQRRVMAGRGFHFTYGAFSTPAVSGGVSAVIDQDRPNVSISIPAGYILVPTNFSVQCQVPLLATDSDEMEILIALDRAAAQDGTGTATAGTINNMRTDLGATGSMATVRYTYSANATNPTLGIELARAVKVGDMNGTPANALMNDLRVDYAPAVPIMITGPACIYVYHGGTVNTTGFGQFQWVEFTTGYANGAL